MSLGIDLNYFILFQIGEKIYLLILHSIQFKHIYENYCFRRNSIAINSVRVISTATLSRAMAVKSMRGTKIERVLKKSQNAFCTVVTVIFVVDAAVDARNRSNEVWFVEKEVMDDVSSDIGWIWDWEDFMIKTPEGRGDDCATGVNDIPSLCESSMVGWAISKADSKGNWQAVTKAGSKAEWKTSNSEIMIIFLTSTGFFRFRVFIILFSNPFISLFFGHGSTPIWNTKNSSTLTVIKSQVPHVLIRRILSLHICSSW